MEIFNSYVSLPEGSSEIFYWDFMYENQNGVWNRIFRSSSGMFGHGHWTIISSRGFKYQHMRSEVDITWYNMIYPLVMTNIAMV
jgi:hypothetical protein